jgi:hypothetical protein
MGTDKLLKNVWIAERLSMGDGSRVSRLTGEFKKEYKDGEITE